MSRWLGLDEGQDCLPASAVELHCIRRFLGLHQLLEVVGKACLATKALQRLNVIHQQDEAIDRVWSEPGGVFEPAEDDP